MANLKEIGLLIVDKLKEVQVTIERHQKGVIYFSDAIQINWSGTLDDFNEKESEEIVFYLMEKILEFNLKSITFYKLPENCPYKTFFYSDDNIFLRKYEGTFFGCFDKEKKPVKSVCIDMVFK